MSKTRVGAWAEVSANHLLLVPLLFNEELYGVVDIASFKEIELHYVTFLQDLGEKLAMVIGSQLNQEKIGKLLEQYCPQADQQEVQLHLLNLHPGTGTSPGNSRTGSMCITRKVKRAMMRLFTLLGAAL